MKFNSVTFKSYLEKESIMRRSYRFSKSELGQIISIVVFIIWILVEFSLPGAEDFLPYLAKVPMHNLPDYMKNAVHILIILIFSEIIGNLIALVFEPFLS